MNLPVSSDPSAKAVCRLLRTKTAFGLPSGDENGSWEDGQSTTAVYWCLATMQPAGPDDDYAHPSTCRQGRGCYQHRDG